MPTWAWLLFVDIALFFTYYCVILTAFMPDLSLLRREKLNNAILCMRQGRYDRAIRYLDHALYSPGSGPVSAQEAVAMSESLDTLLLLIPHFADHPHTLNLRLDLRRVIDGSSDRLDLDKLIGFRTLVGFDDVERVLAALTDGFRHYLSEPDNAEAAPEASAWLQEIARPSMPPRNKFWTIYSLLLSFFPVVAPPLLMFSGAAVGFLLDRATLIALVPALIIAWWSIIVTPVMLRIRGRRIVLLRHFSEASANFVRSSIGPTLGSYGSLVTVSDRFLRQHISASNRMFRGTRRVSDWLSGKRYFPISGKGDWKLPVGYLIRDAHIIVIDLSVISDSLAWEIEQCLELDTRAVVLIYNAEHRAVYELALLRWPALGEIKAIAYSTTFAGGIALKMRFFGYMRKCLAYDEMNLQR